MSSRSVSRIVLGVVTLAISGAAVAGFVWGLPTFLIGLAAGALSLVIVLMWASLQQMDEDGDMEFEQALSYAAPSAEEEQKRALLRTLKDLEYELSVGKISREDYDLVSAEVREKAKRMIALTDETMKEKLEAAERRVEAHLRERDQAESKKRKKRKKGSKNTARASSPPSQSADESSADAMADEASNDVSVEDSSVNQGDEKSKEEEIRS